MKIDTYAHICPKEFIDAFSKRVVNCERFVGGEQRAVSPMVRDIEKRLEIMDRYEDYVQMLVPTGPPAGTYSFWDRLSLL